MTKLNIVLIMASGMGWDHRVIDGVRRWALDRRGVNLLYRTNWHMQLHTDWRAVKWRLVKAELAEIGADGIVADIWTKPMLRGIQRMNLPVVDVSGTWPTAQVPSVMADDEVIGRLAAEHLLDQGFKHFAYWGSRIPLHAQRRKESFVRRLVRAGHCCSIFERVLREAPWREEQDRPLRRWLNSLPKPVGILCWNDSRTIAVQEACQNLELTIPDDVALMGVGNDDLVCQPLRVPLTSVDTNPVQIGYRAAETLARMILTGRRPSRPVVVSPGNVVPRQSTDVLAIENADVVMAVRYMREHADKPINVSDVLANVPISRRSLEMQCRKILGHTPADEIRHQHLERAKRLMQDPTLSMAAIAQMSGFNTPQSLSKLFRRILHRTPYAYRQELLTRSQRSVRTVGA